MVRLVLKYESFEAADNARLNLMRSPRYKSLRIYVLTPAIWILEAGGKKPKPPVTKNLKLL